MTDLVELCNNVVLMTNRPELSSQIQLAVQRATLRAHMLDFWLRDRFEKQVTFQVAGNAFQLDTAVELERWRKFAYIKPFDPVSGLPIIIGEKETLEEVSPDKLFTSVRALKTDCFYTSGSMANIKTSVQCYAFLTGWYKYPSVALGKYSSWIADMLPFVIEEEAAGKIMVATGKVEEGNKFLNKLVVVNGIEGENLHILRVNEVEALAR